MQRSKEFKVSTPGLPTDTIIGYFLGGFGGGYRADNGGITNKKMAIILNVIVLGASVIFLLMGL